MIITNFLVGLPVMLLFLALQAGVAYWCVRYFVRRASQVPSETGLRPLLVAMVANIFFQIPALALAISAIAVVIFSAYILYDINRIVHGGEDNYITATLAVYLDVYNVFVSLLHLLMAFTGDRD